MTPTLGHLKTLATLGLALLATACSTAGGRSFAAPASPGDNAAMSGALATRSVLTPALGSFGHAGVTPSSVRGWMDPAVSTSRTPLLYVALGNAAAVDVFTTGKNRKQVGTISQGLNGPNGPYDLDVDARQNLYVANYSGNNIQVYPRGATAPSATYSSGLQGPLGVVVARDGTVYAANYYSGGPSNTGDIVVYPPGSTQPSKTLTDPSFSILTSLALDGHGNLYVAYMDGSLNGHAAEFKAGSSTATQLGITVHLAYGIGVDSAGDLLLSDFNNSSGQSTVDVFPPGATQPSRVVNCPQGTLYPYQFTFSRNETLLYIALDQSPGKIAIDNYANGQTLTVPPIAGNPTGIAISPRAPL